MRKDRISRGSAVELALSAGCLLFAATLLFSGFGEKASAAMARLLARRSPFTVTETEPQAPTAEQAADMPRAEASRAGFVSADDPKTVASLQEKAEAYLSSVKDKQPAGTVTERFYRDDGATDTVNGIHIKNATGLAPDFASLLAEGPALPAARAEGPEVLVFHTHTTEGYLPAFNGRFYSDVRARTEDPETGVVRVGEALCAALEKAGIGCVHDTAVYDRPYDGAYARSRVSAAALLEEYPSLRVVLDVHRDAIYNGDKEAIKPTALIDGKKTAQVMILTGAEDGGVTDFPGWAQNLRFALALQAKAEQRSPGLTRPLFFCPRKYNMDLSPCGLLLEIGTDVNTPEEALRAGELMGNALAEVMKDAGKQEATE